MHHAFDEGAVAEQLVEIGARGADSRRERREDLAERFVPLEADHAGAGGLALPARQSAEDAARLLGGEAIVEEDLDVRCAEAIEQGPRQPAQTLGGHHHRGAEALAGAVAQGDGAVQGDGGLSRACLAEKQQRAAGR